MSSGGRRGRRGGRSLGQIWSGLGGRKGGGTGRRGAGGGLGSLVKGGLGALGKRGGTMLGGLVGLDGDNMYTYLPGLALGGSVSAL